MTGVSVFNQKTAEFEFRPGPVFAQTLLADEINRATPRTQAALLEAMAERRVSVDGNTYVLKPPFLVIATQNPVDQEGTFALPEAQLDRFLIRLSLGYPSFDEEAKMLARLQRGHPIDDLQAGGAGPGRGSTARRPSARCMWTRRSSSTFWTSFTPAGNTTTSPSAAARGPASPCSAAGRRWRPSADGIS